MIHFLKVLAASLVYVAALTLGIIYHTLRILAEWVMYHIIGYPEIPVHEQPDDYR